MTTVIRICDENENKYSGFELCHPDNIYNLFNNGVYIGLTFIIGKYKYEVVDLSIDAFHKGGSARETLDGGCDEFGTHVWISCKTDDPRIREGNINESTKNSISEDLGLIQTGCFD